MELVPLSLKKIMQTRAYTVIILGTEQKQFAIYTDPAVGKHLQNFLTNEPHPRPYTHDLITTLFRGLDIRPIQAVINNVEDTIYFSRLFLQQQCGEKKDILEIDARPSDCLTIALMHNIPIYCSREVLEKTVPIEG